MNALGAALRALTKLQTVSGAKSAAAHVQSLAELADKLNRQGKTPNGLSAAVRDLNLVRICADELSRRESNKAEFEEIVGLIERVGAFTKAEVETIASMYVGGRPKYPSKKAAVSAIRNKRSKADIFDSKVNVS